MKIRKVKLIKTLTFTSVPAQFSDYEGKSFEAIVSNETITGFKDWLNGGIKAPVGDYEQHSGWDMMMFTDAYTDTEIDRVTQKLQQKLSIFLGELVYPFEDTSEIGMPYIKKKTKSEMDLILLDEISSTQGVANIVNFESEMGEDRRYVAKFRITTTGGESQWLSTEI